MSELAAVIIQLYDLFDPFQSPDLSIADPVRIQHFIGRQFQIADSVLVCMLMHIRALQHLQET